MAMEPGRIEDIQAHGVKTGRWPTSCVPLKTHISYPVKYLLATGELTTGFTSYGPFDGSRKAYQWAEANLKVGEYCRVVTMNEVRS